MQRPVTWASSCFRGTNHCREKRWSPTASALDGTIDEIDDAIPYQWPHSCGDGHSIHFLFCSFSFIPYCTGRSLFCLVTREPLVCSPRRVSDSRADGTVLLLFLSYCSIARAVHGHTRATRILLFRVTAPVGSERPLAPSVNPGVRLLLNPFPLHPST